MVPCTFSFMWTFSEREKENITFNSFLLTFTSFHQQDECSHVSTLILTTVREEKASDILSPTMKA